MKRYMLAYNTWDDDECECVDKLRTFDNEKDLLDEVAYRATKNGDKIISICKFNFCTLEAKKLEIQLNSDMRLIVKEVI